MRKSRLLLSSALAAPAIVHMAAYDNSLTRLIPDLYAGLDVVSRELVGFIPSAFRNASAERAAVGQSVVYPISVPKPAVDTVPAMQIPNPSDTTTDNGTLTISKSRHVEFGWTGEEQRGLNAGGPGYLSVQADNFAQALRTLTNEIETDLGTTAMLGASRAVGTAGTTPFATDLSQAALVRQVLDDNGAPPSDRSLIINTNAGVKLRSLEKLTKANEAGTTMTLRQGELLDIFNLSIKESAGIASHVKGTGAGATTNAAGYAKGAKTITLAAAGTGTVLPGDVITFAGDTNQYIVVSGDTDVSNAGTITIAAPGLRQAIPAAATAITVVNSFAANVGFSRNALHLVARAQALPSDGDAAIDRMMITDPRSGMVFEISVYAGFRKIALFVGLAWGTKAVKSEHMTLLLG